MDASDLMKEVPPFFRGNDKDGHAVLVGAFALEENLEKEGSLLLLQCLIARVIIIFYIAFAIPVTDNVGVFETEHLDPKVLDARLYENRCFP